MKKKILFISMVTIVTLISGCRSTKKSDPADQLIKAYNIDYNRGPEALMVLQNLAYPG